MVGEAWEEVNEIVKDFILHLLSVEGSKRPSGQDALGHPVFNL